jgi:hypothetical protein
MAPSAESTTATSNPKLRVMHAMWRKLCAIRDPEELRIARLEYTAKVLDRRVSSATEMTGGELKILIDQMMYDLSHAHRRVPRSGIKVVEMPRTGEISREQIWKIKQLEAWLGWRSAPERLEGFLKKLFDERLPGDLTFQQGWRAIESLFSLAARARARAALGREPSEPELRAERRRLKEQLRHWRPANSECVRRGERNAFAAANEPPLPEGA